MQLTAKQLRSQVKTALDAVEQGQDVIITRRGQPRARIVAFGQQSASKGTAAEWFGMWANRQDLRNPAAWVRTQRKGRSFGTENR